MSGMDAAPVLVEVTRDPLVESRHRGMISIVDGDHRIIAELGDTSFRTYLRSSAKPHQAISVVASGAADHYGLEPRHLAVMAGSHSGEPIHVSCVREILVKTGLDESVVRCGLHAPFSRAAAQVLGDRPPSVLQNNCSGKHAGMLAHAAYHGLPLENYCDPDHPIQRANRSIVATLAGVREDSLSIGVDGCSAPVFGTSIRAMATCWATLMWPRNLSEDVQRAATRVTAAMQQHPEMVGGTEGRIDTDIIRATGGKVLAKVGAEGVHTLGVSPTTRYPYGLGIAFKIEDGLGDRARNAVAIEILSQSGVLSAEQLHSLAEYHRLDVRNHAGRTVGEVRAAFRLSF